MSQKSRRMCNTVDVKAAETTAQQQPPVKTAFISALETLLREDLIEFGRKLEELSCSASGQKCHMEMIRDILTAHPEYASTPRSTDGSFPLHIAAQIGNIYLGCVIASVVSRVEFSWIKKEVKTPSVHAEVTLSHAHNIFRRNTPHSISSLYFEQHSTQLHQSVRVLKGKPLYT